MLFLKSNLDIFTIKLRLFDQITVSHLQFFYPCKISFVNSILLQSIYSTKLTSYCSILISSFLINSTHSFLLIFFYLFFLDFKNTTINMGWIKLYPLRSKHKIYMLLIFIPPKFYYFF